MPKQSLSDVVEDVANDLESAAKTDDPGQCIVLDASWLRFMAHRLNTALEKDQKEPDKQ